MRSLHLNLWATLNEFVKAFKQDLHNELKPRRSAGMVMVRLVGLSPLTERQCADPAAKGSGDATGRDAAGKAFPPPTSPDGRSH